MSGAGHTPGPYSLDIRSDGERRVCGRHGKIMFRYSAEQDAAATEHVRRLQRGFTADQKRIRDAAPSLLEALEKAVAFYDGLDRSHDDGEAAVLDAMSAAIALARGTAS